MVSPSRNEDRKEMNELYCFEGFCNRLNAMASCLMMWEGDILLRWVQNDHCPLEFHELFRDIERISVTSDPGDWGDYQYARNQGGRFCYYFLDSISPVEIVKKTFLSLIGKLHAFELGDYQDEEMIGFSYRHHYNWEKASVEECLDVLRDISGRTGVRRVYLNCEDRQKNYEICRLLEEKDYEVYWDDSFMSHDLDRGDDSVHDFVRSWLRLTHCRWSISNAVSSTILDAARAIGREAWSIGNVEARSSNHCALHGRYGHSLFVRSRDEC